MVVYNDFKDKNPKNIPIEELYLYSKENDDLNMYNYF